MLGRQTPDCARLTRVSPNPLYLPTSGRFDSCNKPYFGHGPFGSGWRVISCNIGVRWCPSMSESPGDEMSLEGIVRAMHLYPEAWVPREGHIHRRCRIERRDGDRVEGSEVLWFGFAPHDPAVKEEDAESYFLATIMQAMMEGRRLIVHGEVSHRLASNLTEYRDAWCHWLSDTYQAIEFEIDHVVEDAAGQPGAVCGFSGGVDSTFTVWRHGMGLNGYRNRQVVRAVMVHGFDIPIQDRVSFRSALERGTRALSTIGVRLEPIRTNFREVITVEWEHVHAAGLAAALSCFKGVAGSGIIAAGWHYRRMQPPSERARFGAWGSNPLTDHLLSGGGFEIFHDGARYNRREKILELVQWPEGVANLRVCWEGLELDRNCGRCQKCVRTMLAFRAQNLPIPECFPHGDELKENVRKVRVGKVWSDVVKEAAQNGVRDPWVRSLRSALRRRAIKEAARQTVDAILPFGSRRRERAKSLLPGIIRTPWNSFLDPRAAPGSRRRVR